MQQNINETAEFLNDFKKNEKKRKNEVKETCRSFASATKLIYERHVFFDSLKYLSRVFSEKPTM